MSHGWPNFGPCPRSHQHWMSSNFRPSGHRSHPRMNQSKWYSSRVLESLHKPQVGSGLVKYPQCCSFVLCKQGSHIMASCCVSSPYWLLMAKHAWKKKAPAWVTSPAWDCQQGSLPKELLPPPPPDITALGSSQDTVNSAPPVGNEQAPSAAFNSWQSQNAQGQHWLPWQDWFLVQEISNHWPFLPAVGKACKDAWDKLAMATLEDSTQNGLVINRTGSSCHSWFKHLVDAHKVCCYMSGMNILMLIWAQSSETCCL